MRKKAIELTETWNKDLKAGDKIEGLYLKKEIIRTQFGDSEKYVIEVEGGKKLGVFFVCISSSSVCQRRKVHMFGLNI